jgi:probable phosphoglycerate mutase
MTLSLLIVRHGESEGNKHRYFTGHGPSPLTELGVRQAEATARALATTPLDALYVSDLPRARDTAAPLARLAGVTPRERPSLRERNMGHLTGIPFDEVAARHPEAWSALAARDPSYRPEGGESHEDTGHRLAGFLEELFAAHAAGRVAIVSHGIAINHLLQQLLGHPPGAMPPFVFRIENCSVQRLERSERGTLRVLAINDTAHLAALG